MGIIYHRGINSAMINYLVALLLLPIFLSATQIIEVIPDSIFSDYNIPKDFKNVDYGDLSLWGKVAYRLQGHDYEVCATFLNDLPNIHTIIPRFFEPGGVKEDVKYIICSNIPTFLPMRKFLMIPKERLILICWEPPTVFPFQHTENAMNHFHKVLHWDDSKVDGKHIVKMYYPSMFPMRKTLIPFQNRKLSCMVIGKKSSTHSKELYSYREKIVRFYETKPSDLFHLYGRGWSQDDSKNFQGAPNDKSEVMQQYKFCYCLENCRDIPGYVTEKIFDCFQTGTVPIYLGANNITDYVPENCFIDMRKFASLEEVHEHISAMEEGEFMEYIENIRHYLNSDMAKKFTVENLVTTITEIILND